MVPSKALLVCLVFGLCFFVISSELDARELAEKTLDKTNSVEHTAPTKEEKTEANGVKPDYYGGYGGYGRGGYGGYGGYGHGGYGGYGGYGRRGYGGYGGYGRGGYGGHGGYGHGGYGGYYPPERKTQELTSTENPDDYGGGYDGGYGHGYWPRPRTYPPRHWYGHRGGYGGRYPPGGEE